MNYSRIISLPKVWLRNAGIEKGDKIEIAMDEDGNLILTARKEERRQDGQPNSEVL